MNLLNPKYPVLLVDDEEILVDSLELVLNCNGIDNIEKCTDSRKVMNLLSKKKYSVVVLDLTMPYLSGAELFKEISKSFPELPVLILSGNNDYELTTAMVKEAADFYIPKPVDDEMFLSTITELLAGKTKKSNDKFDYRI